MSPSFAKAIMSCLIALTLFSGCSHAPRQKEGSDRTRQPETLPRDYQTALALMESKSYAAAIASLQDFIQNNPGMAGPWLNLGIAYRSNGQPEQAVEALSKAIELNPNHAPAWQQLGIVYREQGQFDAALDAYDKALRLAPDYALAHRNIGILYDLYLQRPEAALEHYRKYLELTADTDSDVHRWVADLERRSGNAQASSE